MPRRRPFPYTVFPYRDGFRCDISFGTDPATGKRRRKSLYGATVAAVEEQGWTLLDQERRGLPVATERRTVEDYLRWWHEQIVLPEAAPRTEMNVRVHLDAHIIPALGHYQLTALGPEHVQAFISVLRRKPGRAGPLKASTIQQILGTLRQALGQAETYGWVPRNVATLVRPPRRARAAKQAFTVAQARTLVQSVREHRLAALFILTATLGLRLGEATGLRWLDVDLDGAVLHLRKQVQRTPGGLILRDLKTAQSHSTVPLPAGCVAALVRHRRRQKEERLQAGRRWEERGQVFTTRTGGLLAPETVRGAYLTLLHGAGLPRLTFHELRHTAASMLVAQGVDQRTAADILRHSPRMLAEVYTHSSASQRRAAVDALSTLLEGVS